MAKYGILVKTVQGSGYFGQYQFYTFINENNEKEVFISDDLVEVDAKIEKMINGDYRVKDLLVVDIYDFQAFADLVEDSKPEPSPEPEDVISISSVDVVVNEDDPENKTVSCTANGENLPVDSEYLWTIDLDNSYINDISVGPVLTLTGDNADAFISATTASAVISVGDYTSDSITFE